MGPGERFGTVVKVIGAGFPRTGTLSQKAALEALGFGPCYHMGEVFKNPRHARAWYRAELARRRGEPFDWEELLGGYEATTDWPGSHFWEELVEAYPNAKVVLSVRDPDRWYESVHRTIYRFRRNIPGLLLVIPVLRWIPRMLDLIWDDTFGQDFEDRAHAIMVFERHAWEVKEKVPPQRLLVFEVREGWGPLCEFLGVEEPDEPFPHVNSSTDRRWLVRGVIATSYAAPVAAGALAGTALIWTVRRFRNGIKRG